MPYQASPKPRPLAMAAATLLALFVGLAGKAALADVQDAQFLDISEYIALHPEQAELMKAFQQRVQNACTMAPQEAVGEPVRIAVVFPGEQVSDYWKRAITTLTRRLNECGLPYDLHEFTSKPVVDRRLQEEQLREALETDPDYLVFTLDATRHMELIERLLNRERPKLILQNITTPVKRWEGRQPFLYVGFDHATGARMLAREYIERVGTNPEYAVLYYSEGYVGAMRGNTFVAYMSQETGIMPMAEFYTDNQRSKTEDAVRRILERGQPDFIYACSTDIALAAASIIQEAGLSGEVLVNGWGGGGPELAALDLGLLDLTVMRLNDDNGVAMAEAIIMDSLGQEDAIPLVYSGGFAIVDRRTAPDRLEHLKEKAFRYSRY